MSRSASRPIAAICSRILWLGRAPAHTNAISRKYGSIATAETRMMTRDKSLCAPELRRSTKPGFGVNSASAINACRARLASHAEGSGSFDGDLRAELDEKCAMITSSESAQVGYRARRTRRPGLPCFVLRAENASPVAAVFRDLPGKRRFPYFVVTQSQMP